MRDHGSDSMTTQPQTNTREAIPFVSRYSRRTRSRTTCRLRNSNSVQRVFEQLRVVDLSCGDVNAERDSSGGSSRSANRGTVDAPEIPIDLAVAVQPNL